MLYWAHRECRRRSRLPIPRSLTGSKSDDIFSWPTASSSYCPTKHITVCVKLTSCSRLMVIETVSLPENSAIGKARRTVPTGMSTDRPPTVAGKADILSPFSLLNCMLMESPIVVILHTSQQTIIKKMSHNIKQTIHLRLRKTYLYPIIIQVRRPFDNTASSCPGSLPLGIIYFHVVLNQHVIVVVQNIRNRFINKVHLLSFRPLLESFLSHLNKQVL